MHILHQFHRLGEHGFVDALDDDFVFIEDGTEDSNVRVIDVAAAKRFDADKIAFDIELLGFSSAAGANSLSQRSR